RGGARIVVGTALVALGGVLVLRASGAWLGDAVVWPLLLGGAGALLVLRHPPTVHRPRGWAAHREPVAAPEPAPRRIGRPQLSRAGLGAALVLLAAFAALWANGALRPAGDVVLAVLVALIAVALVFAPSWRRLARDLALERAERIRSQERADLGAHLHDSVLQTLALIQRSADDPRRVAALARRQERELRAWLAGAEPGAAQARLGAALEEAAAEVEAATGRVIEVVAVGDCDLDAGGRALLAAAREAMLNAAKFSDGGPVDVYTQVSDARIVASVRDRGPGFDVGAIAPERRGVRDSIVARMQRAGGHAEIRSAPGEGTEVELTVERS
ncbi:MAG TPA: ATP-binding protein, partial [Solirubrobacteraceae bacterium]